MSKILCSKEKNATVSNWSFRILRAVQPMVPVGYFPESETISLAFLPEESGKDRIRTAVACSASACSACNCEKPARSAEAAAVVNGKADECSSFCGVIHEKFTKMYSF